MNWNSPVTELTTAATDAAIVLLSIVCIAAVRGVPTGDRWKRAVWSWMFGLLAAGALFGAVVHGFAWPEPVRSFLWMPLYLTLGFAVALFAVGAVHDGFGRRASGRSLPFVFAAAAGFFAATRIGDGSFLWFVIYESVVMVASLAVYVFLAFVRRRPGAGWMALGIALTMVAAAVQAGKRAHLTVVWPINHDGIFHLIQMAALVVLLRGLRTGLGAAAAPERRP